MNFFGRIWRIGLVVPLLFSLIALPVGVRAESGDIGVSAIVPGPAPETPPVIEQPQPNQPTEDKTITVSGTCTAGLIVKVFSNDVFIGSTVCQQNNTFSLETDLLLDQNEIVVRQYDLINQPSPDSAAVTVFFAPTVAQPDSSPNQSVAQVATFQLTIDYDYTSYGVFSNQPFHLPLHFLGGSGPYTVSIDWGDGSVNNFVRQNTDKFTSDYQYARPGLYTAKIKIKDASGEEAYLQFVVLVHGDTVTPLVNQLFEQITKPSVTNPAFISFSFTLFASGIGAGLGLPVLLRFLRGIFFKIK